MHSRTELLSRLRTAVERQPFVRAAWLEGSDAWGRADEFSDVDLWLEVEAAHEEEALRTVREVVMSFGPLTVDDEPAHPDPLIRQQFLGSAGLAPFHFVDVCAQSPGRNVAFTPHDPYLLWFDRAGVIMHAPEPEIDVLKELTRLVRRLWRARLIEKELQRGHPLEALGYYRQEVLPLLVRFLRLRHVPHKLAYGLKHIHSDLLPEVTGRLLTLHSAHQPDELRQGIQEALDWMEEIEKEIRGEP